MNPIHFSASVLDWFDVHGRKNLPWQIDKSAYRVWISEIMLQQTQVTTVIPYYNRFMERFPSLGALAKADEDDVLQYWAGLGYYARARNLHKSARLIQSEYSEQFPTSIEEIEKLPGIGRSTAGAILSLALDKRAAILDGNVKRVLARFHGIEGWTGHTNVAKELWHWAELYTPEHRFDDYTQAMMDLGATLCTRSKPNCIACPLKTACKANRENTTHLLPTPKPKKTLPIKHRWLLHIENDKGELYIEKRPSNGIWGSLWSLPETSFELSEEDIIHHCREALSAECHIVGTHDAFKHTFSHYHLILHPIKLTFLNTLPAIKEAQTALWINSQSHGDLGMAAPIREYVNRHY